ncbi:glycogen synthase GlgA [Methylococcus sp. EFPC2]|uniref:glycogen synthase GlgA n=1 Tax=Methylococcus sp. EFPC2 TaxID=2812648 RepID=UPI0019683416|nr:glycogen synthase GlgA [Methylococcus sp. EFPC2]QSA95761.1 glycogen synthase GlgA [Methylococcus sp. EFPC2]
MTKILFVTSEAYPLMKTGGLADVSGSLPIALKALGHDVRILMPAYADTLASLGPLHAHHVPQAHSQLDILEGLLPGSDVPIWLVAHPGTFDRPGNPYLSPEGKSWTDNAERFALLSRVAVEVAMNRVGFRWKPDIVHCNDWQTGLVPALLGDEPKRPATVFTIHNLAYQGNFPRAMFRQLGLPERFWSHHALEFYDQLSFIKGGLVYADRISTVSPTYAREIQGKEFGCGLEGLLAQRQDRLHGILNGIDEQAWDPARDPYLPHPFEASDLSGKTRVKSALQKRSGLAQDAKVAVIALVGRLVQQKGIDLVIDVLPQLLELPLQLVILGSGERKYEHALEQWTRLYPDRIALTLGYDEALAHLIEAGADLFLMPSRFEPCGLNQMYSQRYGAAPIVRSVGGLADTVEDASAENLAAGTASGIAFAEAKHEALLQAVYRALELFHDKPVWEQIQRTGMNKDFSWHKSARQYEAVYALAEQDCQALGHSMLARGALA